MAKKSPNKPSPQSRTKAASKPSQAAKGGGSSTRKTTKAKTRSAKQVTKTSKATKPARKPPLTRLTGEQIPAAPLPPDKLPKTRLSKKDLEYFKDILLRKRAQILGDIHLLNEQSLKNNRREASGDLSSMPFHPADAGSDTFEQDFAIGLVENESELVREIEEALGRIENQTYGVCIATGKPITKVRLQAKPWANYCIEYARLVETGRAPRV